MSRDAKHEALTAEDLTRLSDEFWNAEEKADLSEMAAISRDWLCEAAGLAGELPAAQRASVLASCAIAGALLTMEFHLHRLCELTDIREE
jgi:hypothetical protein